MGYGVYKGYRDLERGNVNKKNIFKKKKKKKKRHAPHSSHNAA
jgi:hypothetical protein